MTTGGRTPAWDARLHELAERHRVPGATLGILRLRPDGEDDQVQAAYGVLSRATGVEVTTDSLFQIGSITKPYTATLVMQLVEAGRVDLDSPVAAVLPGLRLGDPEAARSVTMRQLLTHTSGIDGDVFWDTGGGDDCIERFVDRLDEVAQTFPPGATWSYCNTGFTLAGRVVEELTGRVWDRALHERLVAPLGLAHTVTLAEDALLFRTAVGHLAEGGAEPHPTPVWALPRSTGPAGRITASVADVLAFARMHLGGGRAGDGTPVLGEAAVAQMQERQVDVPGEHGLADSWGLGWMRFDWGGRLLLGHDGNTVGQSAFLRMLPEQGLAVALLTNGGHPKDLYHDLFREVFAELADVEMPPPFVPPAQPPQVDAGPHLGTYESAGNLVEVFERDGKAMLRDTTTGLLAEMLPEPVREFELHPVEQDLFALRDEDEETWSPVTFYSLPTGERYLHLSGRAIARTG